MSPSEFRRGAALKEQIAVLAIFLVVGFFTASVFFDDAVLSEQGALLAAFGGIGLWRWGWAFIHYTRACLYRYIVFPRIRRRAAQAVAERGPVDDVFVLATTYHEEAWITREVFASVFRELATLKHLRRPPVVVVVTGCDDDDLQVQQVYADVLDRMRPTAQNSTGESSLAANEVWPPELVLLRGDRGKRPAIALGLKTIRRRDLGNKSVVFLMDGDSALRPGLMRKVLPLFRLTPSIAAATTNEDGYVRGPAWFAEWISLRFGQRHLYMCSVSLSSKVLCLTGRLSAIRGDLATRPEFIDQVENDSLHHWLFGRYAMLSGDDKSTWFHLANRGERMLYVPDALSTTYEVIEGSSLRRARANIARWSGNMLRNSWRAMRLGPAKLGLFPWLCIVDQRISMWTVLIGPISAILAVVVGWYEFLAGYVLWLIFSRWIRVAPAMVHGRRFSAYYVPLQVFSEWLGAVSKIWVAFHPAKQTWFNRGGRTLDCSARASHRWVRKTLATYFLVVAGAAFVFSLSAYLRLIPFLDELALISYDPFFFW